MEESVCVGCGCSDYNPCQDSFTQEPCFWLVVDRKQRIGVCSCCPDKLPEFTKRIGKGEDENE